MSPSAEVIYPDKFHVTEVRTQGVAARVNVSTDFDIQSGREGDGSKGNEIPVEKLYGSVHGKEEFLGLTALLISNCQEILDLIGETSDSINEENMVSADLSYIEVKKKIQRLSVYAKDNEAFALLIWEAIKRSADTQVAHLSIENINILRKITQFLKNNPNVKMWDAVEFVERIEASHGEVMVSGIQLIVDQAINEALGSGG